jgi:hypothetical protein
VGLPLAVEERLQLTLMDPAVQGGPAPTKPLLNLLIAHALLPSQPSGNSNTQMAARLPESRADSRVPDTVG